MKKSLLALAVLAAFAGAASAQSSVTLYGRVDLSVGKNAGAKDKFLANGSGSRLGVRGVEDLGGGLKALFNVEHRFNADTGANTAGMTPTSRFWHGRSIVGLQGGFGQVTLGRDYTTSFLQSQLVADPWGLDTVSANTAIVTGGIGTVRNDSTITYRLTTGGFAVGAQVAEATDAINNTPNKPMNSAVSYAGGPLTIGFGHERPGSEAAASAKWTTVNAAYSLGPVTLGGFFGTGNTAADAKVRSYLVSAVATMGQGELRASFGRLQSDPAGASPRVTTAQLTSVGYHYSLSKRTTLYADVVNNSKAATSKTGYDFGIKHNF